jgi:predicted transcriptional regulator
MNSIKITVGPITREEMSKRFLDAWHRAERGEMMKECHFTFGSLEALTNVLTSKRIELLRFLRRHPVKDANELAQGMGRAIQDVEADLKVLVNGGFIEADEDGLKVEFDGIDITMPL